MWVVPILLFVVIKLTICSDVYYILTPLCFVVFCMLLFVLWLCGLLGCLVLVACVICVYVMSCSFVIVRVVDCWIIVYKWVLFF